MVSPWIHFVVRTNCVHPQYHSSTVTHNQLAYPTIGGVSLEICQEMGQLHLGVLYTDKNNQHGSIRAVFPSKRKGSPVIMGHPPPPNFSNRGLLILGSQYRNERGIRCRLLDIRNMPLMWSANARSIRPQDSNDVKSRSDGLFTLFSLGWFGRVVEILLVRLATLGSLRDLMRTARGVTQQIPAWGHRDP